jgi:hypothetical protein
MNNPVITKNADGTVTVAIGDYSATFDKGVDTNMICVGVENLIEMSTGLSAFQISLDVMKEFVNADG